MCLMCSEARNRPVAGASEEAEVTKITDVGPYKTARTVAIFLIDIWSRLELV